MEGNGKGKCDLSYFRKHVLGSSLRIVSYYNDFARKSFEKKRWDIPCVRLELLYNNKINLHVHTCGFDFPRKTNKLSNLGKNSDIINDRIDGDCDIQGIYVPLKHNPNCIRASPLRLWIYLQKICICLRVRCSI